MRRAFLAATGLSLVVLGTLIPVGGGMATDHLATSVGPKGPDDAGPPAARPEAHGPVNLLFIHHSVGGRLLAAPGVKDAMAPEIWRSHPEGGDLRRLLEGQGYVVHEASYGSALGDATDRADWLPKFRDHMDKVLACEQNDRALSAGQRNQVVLFKSCFPENLLADDAALEKARAELSALLPVFARHPDVLFVHLTSPPQAPRVPAQPAWKWLARALTGKPQPLTRLVKSGPLARRLARWTTSPEGWLKDYPARNVAAFDLFDVLTDHGASDFSAYATGDGTDAHPSRRGNERVAAELVPFLDRATRSAAIAGR